MAPSPGELPNRLGACMIVGWTNPLQAALELSGWDAALRSAVRVSLVYFIV